VSSEVLFTALVVAVGLERLAELVLTRRNVAWALARGGTEHGQGHYPAMVVLHSALLVGALAEVWLLHRVFVPWLGWTALVLVLASQGLRWWCITSLGRRWSTRVVVLPGEPLVARGPYRRLRHPNYVAVVVEGLALPLVHGAWLTAVVFTVLNAVLLRTRIRVEDRALAEASGAAR
jgi:methyltransferase